MLVTHDQLSYKATSCHLLSEANDFIQDYDVICIDEIQFYEDASEICDLWANNGKIVIASGLNGDFKREPFEQISKLLPKAEKMTFLSAICTQTGKEASFSKRISNEKEVKVIGGSEKYIATSRKAYFTDTNYEMHTQIERI